MEARFIQRLCGAILVLALQPATAVADETARFEAPVRLGEGAQWRFTPVLVDVNGDGRRDIVTTHRKPTERNALHVWARAESGEFQELPQDWPSPGYSALAVGDLDADGDLDILAASHFRKIVTYLGDGKGGFSASAMKRDRGYAGAALADLDGDGSLEAVVLADSKGGIQIYRRDKGEWQLEHRLWEGNIGRDLALGDVNNDGMLDIVVAGGPTDGGVVFVQTASRSWERRSERFPSATGIFQSVALGDVNGDGSLDIALNGGATGDGSTNGPDVFLGDGTGGNWRPASDGLKVIGHASRGLALGDVDGDGDLDLVAGGNPDGSLTLTSFGLYLFRGDGAGGWGLDPRSGLPPSGLAATRGIALGDLDSDGKADMVVTHGYTVVEGRSEVPKEGGYLTVWRQAQKQE